MPVYRSAYHSRLYRDFKGIHPDAYRDIIRFYDENESDIRQLDFDEYFELLVIYVDALFDAGKYRKHLVMVDHVIELTIQRNIYRFQQRDLYRAMLLKKGLSLVRTHEFERAQHIFRELLRMNPRHTDVIRHLEESIHLAGSPGLHTSRALAIGSFFLSAILIGIEILLIRPFYEHLTPILEWSRNGLFVLGLSILYIGYWLHRRRSAQAAQDFVRNLKDRSTPTDH